MAGILAQLLGRPFAAMGKPLNEFRREAAAAGVPPSGSKPCV